MSHETLRLAFTTRDLKTFLDLVFPPGWAPITARILESGATMSENCGPWAPRITPVPPTVRTGPTDIATHVKSCLYRAHDCIHQLWGLPIPGESFTPDEFYVYKRAQMCGEVAVLTLTELCLARHWRERWPELAPILDARNALPMRDRHFADKSTQQIAARLDGLLHRQDRPRWVRDCPHATAFCDDYVPMLEGDRAAIDHNWALMRRTGWRPLGGPNVRYDASLDGLELTLWLIDDFYHLLGTDPVVDQPLAAFNQARRKPLVLPAGWNQP